MTYSLENISRRLDVISNDLELTAKRQDTISQLLALLAVHIPDVVQSEDDCASIVAQGSTLPCLCQVTFSDLKVGG